MRDFAKVDLNPGEEKDVHIVLDRDCFEYYDIEMIDGKLRLENMRF